MNDLEINEKTCSYLLLCGRLTEVVTYNTSDNNSFSRRFKSWRRITMQGEQADASVCSLVKSFFCSPISF